jgi:hypothetical protein
VGEAGGLLEGVAQDPLRGLQVKQVCLTYAVVRGRFLATRFASLVPRFNISFPGIKFQDPARKT